MLQLNEMEIRKKLLLVGHEAEILYFLFFGADNVACNVLFFLSLNAVIKKVATQLKAHTFVSLKICQSVFKVWVFIFNVPRFHGFSSSIFYTIKYSLEQDLRYLV